MGDLAACGPRREGSAQRLSVVIWTSSIPDIFDEAS